MMPIPEGAPPAHRPLSIPSAQQRVRVAIAHDDALVADIIERACVDKDLDVVHVDSSLPDLAEAVTRAGATVVVTGTQLDRTTTDDVLDKLLNADIRAIVVSRLPNAEHLTALLSRGVSGYLLYDSSPDEISLAVQAVARGGLAINPTAAAQLVQQWRVLHAHVQGRDAGVSRVLTPREREVLTAMADGLPTKVIARVLGVATKTVENHKLRIFEKLNVRTHAQAVTVAITYGLVGEAMSGPDPTDSF